jgi:hypothetical protein
MKVEDLREKLKGAQEYTSTVSIDWVLSALESLETATPVRGLTQDLADLLADKIERSLDSNSNDLVDYDSAEFEINHNNCVELNRVELNVSNVMDQITDCLDELVIEPGTLYDGSV